MQCFQTKRVATKLCKQRQKTHASRTISQWHALVSLSIEFTTFMYSIEVYCSNIKNAYVKVDPLKPLNDSVDDLIIPERGFLVPFRLHLSVEKTNWLAVEQCDQKGYFA